MANPQYQCDNCHFLIDEASEEAMNPIRDLQERIEPGGVVPAGECPQCGALMYLVE